MGIYEGLNITILTTTRVGDDGMLASMLDLFAFSTSNPVLKTGLISIDINAIV